MKPTIFALTLILLCTSCAVEHRIIPKLESGSIQPLRFNHNDSLSYGYFKDLLELSDNKRLKRWAKRNDYNIIGFEVTNVGSEFTKGFQLKYYLNNQRITPIRNAWIARKARQKVNGMALLAIPVSIIEWAIFPKEPEYDAYGFDQTDYTTVSMKMAESNNSVRKQANKELLNNLVRYEISDKVLPKGIPVYGIIVLKGNIDLSKLEVRR